MKGMRYYLFIKDSETEYYRYQGNFKRRNIICLSRIMKLKYYLLSKIIWEDETLSVYQDNETKIICLSKINMSRGKQYLFIKIMKLKYYSLSKIIEDETLSVYQGHWSWTSFVIKTIWRERDIICLSKIMKLGIICYQR